MSNKKSVDNIQALYGFFMIGSIVLISIAFWRHEIFSAICFIVSLIAMIMSDKKFAKEQKTEKHRFKAFIVSIVILVVGLVTCFDLGVPNSTNEVGESKPQVNQEVERSSIEKKNKDYSHVVWNYVNHNDNDRAVKNVKKLIEVSNYYAGGWGNSDVDTDILPVTAGNCIYTELTNDTIGYIYKPSYTKKRLLNPKHVDEYLKPIRGGRLRDYYLLFKLYNDSVVKVTPFIQFTSRKNAEEAINLNINSYMKVSAVRMRKKEYLENIKLMEHEKELLTKAERLKERRNEFEEKCISSWDGACNELERVVKKSMKDPSSYEHIETVYKVDDDYMLVVMSFRGKNSFGALVVNRVAAKVSFDCDVISVQSE